MRLVGWQGKGVYLIEVAPRADGKRMAQILDLNRGIPFDPWLLGRIHSATKSAPQVAQSGLGSFHGSRL